MGLLRRALPTTNVGLALAAWRYRHAVVDTARFAGRAVDQLRAGDHKDVVTEARLRAKMLSDPRVRSAAGLRVEVRDGVARLSGTSDPEVQRAVYAAVEATPGVTRIRDDAGRRRRFRR